MFRLVVIFWVGVCLCMFYNSYSAMITVLILEFDQKSIEQTVISSLLASALYLFNHLTSLQLSKLTASIFSCKCSIVAST